MWFSKGALGAFVGTPEDLLDPPETYATTPALNTNARVCPVDCTVCLEPTVYGRGPVPEIERCPYCEGIFTDTTSLARMRVAARSRARATENSSRARTQATVGEIPLRDPDTAYTQTLSLRVTAWSLPAAFALGLVARTLALPMLFVSPARVFFHELGHGVAAWSCSWRALPLPIGLTVIIPGRSVWVYCALSLASGAIVYLGVKFKSWVFSVGAIGFFTALTYVTWWVAEPSQRLLVSFAGVAGEFIVAALCTVLFFTKFPPRLRWDFWRWPVLLLGAMVLVEDLRYWHSVSRDFSRIPWGGLYADDGDLTQLRNDHGWSALEITSRIMAVGWLAFAASVTAWAVSLFTVWRRTRHPRET